MNFKNINKFAAIGVASAFLFALTSCGSHKSHKAANHDSDKKTEQAAKTKEAEAKKVAKKKIVGDPNYQGAWAQVPVILKRIHVPTFPDYTIDITSEPYAADPTGKFDSRPAIQNAMIDVSRYGGGTVTIPAGKYFVDGPLNLQNNVNLHLEEGSEIIFSTNYYRYLPQVLTRYEGSDLYSFSPLIYAYQKHDVAITGYGTINGQAKHAWATFVKKAAEESAHRIAGSVKNKAEQVIRDMNNQDVPLWKRKFDLSDHLRTDFILFYDTQNILVEGVKIIDSPFWINHMYRSKNITVRNIKMQSKNKNNDGLDIESSEDVYVHDVDFATGDDCITIKSSRDLEGLRKMIPSKNIVVQHVRFLADDGIALGSEASGGVRNVFIENSSAKDMRKGFYYKSNKNRGAHFEHIRVRNLKFADLLDSPENQKKLNMLEITTDYDFKGVKYNRNPEFKDMRFENIRGGTSIVAVKLLGTKEAPIKDMVFDNVHLGSGVKPNIIREVQKETMFFRDFQVGNQPIVALQSKEAKEQTAFPQTDNTPPDVYAGEEQVISLAVTDNITFHGNVMDKEGQDVTYQWKVIGDDKEPVSMGEDDYGNNVNYKFGKESDVEFSSADKIDTKVTFHAPGMYRIRLNANDGSATGYHTVFVDVRK